MIRGVVGEFGVDAGGPAADTVDVGAEFGEFAGIGVDDPAVRVPGFLPSGDAFLVQPLADGAGGHAEFGREQRQPPLVFSRCVVGVGGQGLAPVGDRRSGAVQDLRDEAVANVVPTGFNLDGDKGVLEIGAHDLPDRGQNRRYMIHIRANPYVAFVVDDLATEPTWAPRGVSVRGPAQIHPKGGERLAPGFGPIWVEIIPESISAWGIDTSVYEQPNSRKVVTP